MTWVANSSEEEKQPESPGTYLFRCEMTYLKTSWFSFGNFFNTSLRACNFCSRSLISEDRGKQRLRVEASG
jgi:hypothetical protein